ncbi:hypothetical protein BRADI_3g43454v3 [Brachypodium distachyon]|uniref:Uncharacterized protein n=1 Tax=Brachypodium distachyon TaxID=15368 RepID=A0A2K2D2Y1_BRADI|nr:hypothetical protein BRADI_3g43454v3 [Brachypodium distachyon]
MPLQAYMTQHIQSRRTFVHRLQTKARREQSTFPKNTVHWASRDRWVEPTYPFIPPGAFAC